MIFLCRSEYFIQFTAKIFYGTCIGWGSKHDISVEICTFHAFNSKAWPHPNGQGVRMIWYLIPNPTKSNPLNEGSGGYKHNFSVQFHTFHAIHNKKTLGTWHSPLRDGGREIFFSGDLHISCNSKQKLFLVLDPTLWCGVQKHNFLVQFHTNLISKADFDTWPHPYGLVIRNNWYF